MQQIADDFNEYVEARAALLNQAPFFASMLYEAFKHKVGYETPTMGTDGKTLFINPDYMKTLTVGERVFGLAHEGGHWMWQHAPRAKHYMDNGFDGNPFLPMLWNFAGDFIINSMLIEEGVGDFKDGWLCEERFKDYRGFFIDDVYRTLYDEMPKQPQTQAGQGKPCDDGEGGVTPPGGSGSGKPCDDGEGGVTPPGGSGSGKPGDQPGTVGGGGSMTEEQKEWLESKGHQFDEHMMPDDETGPTKVEYKRILASAKANAKAMGNMPAGLERVVDSLIEGVVEWNDKLRFQVSTKTGRDASNWNRPHRRLWYQTGIYFPSRVSFDAGIIAIGYDSSGSIDMETEGAYFFGETGKVIEDANPEAVIIIPCDAKVYEDRVEWMDSVEDVANYQARGTPGGGGTSFVPVFEYLEEEGIEPDCLIYLTDMMGMFPKVAPDYPVIWVSTAGIEVAPFGEVINVDIAEMLKRMER